MIKYRFKTKEEFIEEFGHQWKDKVNWNNKTGMDYLLGTNIPDYTDEYFGNSFLDFGIKRKNNNFLSWCISPKMVKKIYVIDYNEKKTLVYD